MGMCLSVYKHANVQQMGLNDGNPSKNANRKQFLQYLTNRTRQIIQALNSLHDSQIILAKGKFYMEVWEVLLGAEIQDTGPE